MGSVILVVIRKHWRGAYALPVAFWLITPASWVFVSVAPTGVEYLSIYGSYSPLRSLLTMLATVAVLYGVLIWQAVGTLRAARTYWRARPTWRRWLFAAPVAAIVLLPLMGSVIATRNIARIGAEIVQQIASNDAETPDYSLKLSEDDEELAVAGGGASNTAWCGIWSGCLPRPRA